MIENSEGGHQSESESIMVVKLKKRNGYRDLWKFLFKVWRGSFCIFRRARMKISSLSTEIVKN